MSNLKVAGIVGLLFAFWLSAWWWNLGLGIIGVFVWACIVFMYPSIWKNGYLRMLALSNLLLTLLMWQGNNLTVKFFSFTGWGLMTGTLVVLAKNPKGFVGWKTTLMTFISGIGSFFSTPFDMVNTLEKHKSGDEKFRKILIGIVMSVPVIFIFGTLFYSADPLFVKLVNSLPLPHWTIDGNLLWKIISTLLFGSGIYALLKTKLAVTNSKINESRFGTEATIVITSVAALFFIFDILQIRYITTSAIALQKMGIMLSEYTQRGYTQMIFAGLLGFILIGIVEQLSENKYFKKLQLLFLGEIIWLIAAATQRNYLYQSRFGLTETRILGFFLSMWLIIACILTAIKIVKSIENGWLIKFLLLTAGWVLILLNLANTDYIVGVLRQPNLGYGIDYFYITDLSADGYLGWESVLKKIEKDIASKPALDEEIEQNDLYLIDHLRSKLVGELGLGAQSENYWHHYGAWNLSSREARRYLLKNWGRMITLENILQKQTKH